jgi:UDP-sulfoquinovose synthase
VGAEIGLNVAVQQLANPRKEAEEHYYNPQHTGLLDLGLEPHYLTDERLAGMLRYVQGHADRIAEHRIFRGTQWA